MKTMLIIASLALMTGTVFAGEKTSCHPMKGNWVNAATTACTTSGGENTYPTPKPDKCHIKA